MAQLNYTSFYFYSWLMTTLCSLGSYKSTSFNKWTCVRFQKWVEVALLALCGQPTERLTRRPPKPHVVLPWQNWKTIDENFFCLCVWVWVCFLWLKWSTMYIPQVGLGLRDLIWCVYLHESSWYNISNQIFHAPCFVVWKKRFLTYRPPTTETPRVLSSGMLHQLACSAMSSTICPTQWTVDKVPTLPNPML